MPIAMDNGAKASVSLPSAFLCPSSCVLACLPHETRAGGWALWWPSVTFKPLPWGTFRGFFLGGAERSILAEKKKNRGYTQRLTLQTLYYWVRHSPPPLPLQKSSVCQWGGGPIVHRPAAEEKRPLVVNNSAVRSDHNGDTSLCCEHLLE